MSDMKQQGRDLLAHEVAAEGYISGARLIRHGDIDVMPRVSARAALRAIEGSLRGNTAKHADFLSDLRRIARSWTDEDGEAAMGARSACARQILEAIEKHPALLVDRATEACSA